MLTQDAGYELPRTPLTSELQVQPNSTLRCRLRLAGHEILTPEFYQKWGFVTATSSRMCSSSVSCGVLRSKGCTLTSQTSRTSVTSIEILVASSLRRAERSVLGQRTVPNRVLTGSRGSAPRWAGGRAASTLDKLHKHQPFCAALCQQGATHASTGWGSRGPYVHEGAADVSSPSDG